MIKLIVSDLDGTLLNAQHQLDAYSADAIKKAQACGFTFMVATGRHGGSVYPFFQEHGIKCTCILLNGAVYQNEQEEILKEVTLDHKRARLIMDVLNAYDISSHIYSKEGIATQDPQRIENEFVKRMQEREQMSREEVQQILDQSNFCKFDIHIHDLDAYFATNPTIYKIEAFDNNDARMDEARDALRKVEHIEITASVGQNIEVTDALAQKGFMLDEVIREMGITKEEVVLFGDSMNDLSMMEMFPHSTAVSNADAQILAASHHVIKSNIEHGVADAIYDILNFYGK